MARLNLDELAAREEQPQPVVDTKPMKAPAPAAKKVPTTKRAPKVETPAATNTANEPTSQESPPATSEKPEDSSSGDKTVGVPVHLPDDINIRLLAWMKLTGRSHPVVLLDAIETVYEQLGDLIQQKLGPDDRPKTSLFQRSNRQAPKTNPGENPHKHTVRIDKGARDVLDDLTAKFAAPSRNFLLIAAYDGYLLPVEQIAEQQRSKDEEAAKNQKENG